MISLRQLEDKDAPLMLEWMHDPKVQRGFKKNMLAMTLEDAKRFIASSPIPKQISTGDDLHYAIVNDGNEYLGTISLKRVDLDNKTAEYAISTRKKINGKGIAYEATRQLLKKAFFEFGLHRVYLSVLADNGPAIHLYEKCGFRFEGEFRDHILRESTGKYVNWKWYGILSSEFKDFE